MSHIFPKGFAARTCMPKAPNANINLLKGTLLSPLNVNFFFFALNWEKKQKIWENFQPATMLNWEKNSENFQPASMLNWKKKIGETFNLLPPGHTIASSSTSSAILPSFSSWNVFIISLSQSWPGKSEKDFQLEKANNNFQGNVKKITVKE